MQDNQASNNRLDLGSNLNVASPLNNPPPPQRRRRNEDVESSMFRVGITEENIAYIEEHRILFLAGKVAVVDPKDESYFRMLKNTFCPSVELYSLTTALILVNTVVFIVELSLGFDSAKTVLEVNSDTLFLMGMNDSHLVYKGQVYRLVVAQFLHLNMLHIICNTLIMLLLVSRMEYTFGKARVLLVYILSGIAGDIFSDILYTDKMLKAGSSTSLYGMIGLSIGYIIINWPSFRRIGFIFKFKIILIVVMLTAFLLLFSDVAEEIDYIGHLGAFIGGFFLTSIM
jgi:rhomboid protease GluP